MVSHDLRFDVNCSILFTELPLLQRPAAAKAAGFDAVEFWWPWPDAPAPADRTVDAFVAAVRDAGVTLVGLNFFGGDIAGPDAGAMSVPSLASSFHDNIDVAVGIGRRLGVRVFNALYGNRVEGVSTGHQDDLAAANLADAAGAAAGIGAAVVLEPLSGAKPYPLRTAADAVAVADRLAREHDATNVGLLADLYHLSVNGDDVAAAITSYATRVGHVQIADAPGRHEPGTGTVQLDRHLAALERAGYTGSVGVEYVPSGPSGDSFGWLPPERRAFGWRESAPHRAFGWREPDQRRGG